MRKLVFEKVAHTTDLVWVCGLVVVLSGKACAKVRVLSTQQSATVFYVNKLVVLCASFDRVLHNMYASIFSFSYLFRVGFYSLSTPPIRTTMKNFNFI